MKKLVVLIPGDDRTNALSYIGLRFGDLRNSKVGSILGPVIGCVKSANEGNVQKNSCLILLIDYDKADVLNFSWDNFTNEDRARSWYYWLGWEELVLLDFRSWDPNNPVESTANSYYHLCDILGSYRAKSLPATRTEVALIGKRNLSNANFSKPLPLP